MFLEENMERIQAEFDALVLELPQLSHQLCERLAGLDGQTALAMKYLYSNMPLSDIGNYSFDTYLDYACHGVYLWEHSPFIRNMPEDIFLNYVLFHRVNEEEIAPCRSLFYGELKEQICGMGMQEAALSVNRWCAQEVSYQSTDDRTASALGVWRCGCGRCGEESVFAVNALRSAGIPARQVYAVKWSHCDDNHAWVEVWCDGTWHYLGACEPEPVLDRGWFTNAASRAMAVSSRWFDRADSGEEVIGRDGINAMLNQLPRYARTRRITVRVEDSDRKPVPGARISAEVLNYAEFSPIAMVTTGEDGCASLTTGFGSLHLAVTSDGRYGECIVDTREETQATIRLKAFAWASGRQADRTEQSLTGNAGQMQQSGSENSNCKQPSYSSGIAEETFPDHVRSVYSADGEESGSAQCTQASDTVWTAFDMAAPGDTVREALHGTDEQEAENTRAVTAAAELCRKKREHFRPAWQDVFFVRSPEYTRTLMSVLSEKDRQDAPPEVLQEHYEESAVYEEQFPQQVYLSFVWNPRIADEVLTNWRHAISAYFTREEQDDFRAAPKRIWSWIQVHIRSCEERERTTVYTTPAAALQLGIADEKSQKVLFVAIARTLGIPSRLNPADGALEYWRDGVFVPVQPEQKRSAHLHIKGSGDTAWIYFQNWSIARMEEDGFHSLRLPGTVLQDEVPCSGVREAELALAPGRYRVLTANRLPSGTVYGFRHDFVIREGECRELTLALRQVNLADMLDGHRLPPMMFQNEAGEECSLAQLTAKKSRLLLWLDVGKEPTEHILNELMERQEAYREYEDRLVFILRREEERRNPTFAGCSACMKQARICYGPAGKPREMAARSMYTDPEKLPLLILTDGLCHGVFAAAGYSVGMADLLLRIWKCVEEG